MMNRKSKPNLNHLKVLHMMLTERVGIISSSIGGRSYTPKFFRYNPELKYFSPDQRDWFATQLTSHSSIITNFVQWSWMNRFEEPTPSDPNQHSFFSWYQHPFVLNKNAVRYWEAEGAALYEKLLAEEQAKRDSVERLIAIRPRAKLKNQRKAGMLVRVVRETAKRLYVEVVEMAGDRYSYNFEYVEGNHGKYYISRDQIFREHITVEQFKKLAAIEDEIMADNLARRTAMDEEIKAIRQRYAERDLQNDAYHDSQLAAVFGEDV